MIAAIRGDDKTGKTSLILTFPKPLFHMDFDVGGFNRASHRFRQEIKDGLVVSKSYHIPQQSLRSRMGLDKAAFGMSQTNKVVGIKELWYQMLTDYIEVLEGVKLAPNGEKFRTVAMDPFPQVWDICTTTVLQEKQERQKSGERLREQLLQIEYGEPNQRLRAILHAAREVGMHLALGHFMVDEFGKRLVKDKLEDVVVGKKSAGWKYIRKEADLEVTTEFRTVTNNGSGPTTTPFGTVTLCGLALGPEGHEIMEPTFDQLVQLVSVYRDGPLES